MITTRSQALATGLLWASSLLLAMACSQAPPPEPATPQTVPRVAPDPPPASDPLPPGPPRATLPAW